MEPKMKQKAYASIAKSGVVESFIKHTGGERFYRARNLPGRNLACGQAIDSKLRVLALEYKRAYSDWQAADENCFEWCCQKRS